MLAAKVKAIAFGLPLVSYLFGGSLAADTTQPFFSQDVVQDPFVTPNQGVASIQSNDLLGGYSTSTQTYSNFHNQQQTDTPSELYMVHNGGQSIYNRNRRNTTAGRSWSSTRQQAEVRDSRDRRSRNYYYQNQPVQQSRSQQDSNANYYYQNSGQYGNDQYDQYAPYQYDGDGYSELYNSGKAEYYPNKQFLNPAGTVYSRRWGPIGNGFFRMERY